ncbi:hypothetical protein PR048_026736 [Dryococelus australis]|uniref:RNA-directed DNA polymerase n=1 Tax=Dryococelus australis TaxID=614101 RepID=A0ABQ9GM83_9NEOP|nr:hypothetical protein PR048_026736 [Dryococelus australis]
MQKREGKLHPVALKLNAHSTARITRWALKMLEYSFEIKYSSNKKHAHVDSLSRNPVDQDLLIVSLPGFDMATAQIIKEIEKPSPVETKHSRVAKNYCLREGVLYKFNTRPRRWGKLLVIPEKLKDEILNESHNNPIIGRRLEVARTIDKIRRRYYWHGRFEDVETYVRTCIDCQTKKGTNQKPTGLLQLIPVREPFGRVITCIDYGTRWAETQEVPAGTAQEVAQFLLETFYLWFYLE